MVFVEPRSDAWFRSGLGKSAFTPRIYGGLLLDNYLPLFDTTFQMYRVRMKRDTGLALYPKFYMVHDTSLMFYRPYEEVLASLKKKPKRASAWWKLISETVKSSEFMRVNEVTKGSQELAALAAAKFLASLLRRVADQMKSKGVSVSATDFLDKQSESALASLFGQDAQQLRQAISEALQEAAAVASEYKDAREEAEEAANLVAGSGGSGYTHDALSVWSFLKNPDEFRRRVRILKWAAIMMREFTSMIPTSLQHQQMVSMYGGVSGTTRMLTESQLRDILPSELAALAAENEKLAKYLRYDLLLRLLSKQVNVYQRAAAIKPVIFVDKSGSMAEEFGGGVPKISVAAGFALAIYWKLNGEVYLFDTEVERVKPGDVVKMLLTIEADGGTDITEVLREILRIGKKEHIYIIVTDAIDEVSEDVISELEKRGLAPRIRFIIVPPAWEEEEWLHRFRHYRVDSVAEFKKAAKVVLE